MDFNSFMFPSQYKQHRNSIVVYSTHIEIIAKLQKKLQSYLFTFKMIFSGVHNKNKWKK